MRKHPSFKKILLLLLFLIILLEAGTAFSNTNNGNFRRHYLVFYDVSGEFQRCENANPNLRRNIISLFSNEGLSDPSRSFVQIETEDFFNPATDNISLFYFGLSWPNYQTMREYYWQRRTPDQLFDNFTDLFFDKKADWTDFLASNQSVTSAEYFDHVLPSSFIPFGNGITLSNIVYPAALMNKIHTSADEYYIIIVSDFLSGSNFGNRMDYRLISELFHHDQNIYLGFINILTTIENSFYNIKVLEVDFPTICLNRTVYIGLLGYRILPLAGASKTENPIIRINSNLELRQRAHESPEFRLPPIDLYFLHNQKLTLSNINMNISDANGNLLYNDELAGRNNGDLFSPFTQKEIKHLNETYLLPPFRINTPYIADIQPDTLDLAFKIVTEFQFLDNRILRYNYSVSRTLDSKSIIYKSHINILIMQILIPALLVFILVIILLYKGRPNRIGFKIEELADTYEKFDYEGDGRIKAPYLPWVFEGNDCRYNFPVSYKLIYKSRQNIFWRKIPVYLTLHVDQCPAGFEVFVEGEDYALITDKTDFKVYAGSNARKFQVVINQIDTTKTITDPELISFHIAYNTQVKKIFPFRLNGRFSYKFFVGPDLGNVFIAFDPGTTGSCVASGTETSDVYIETRAFGEGVITPSIVTITPPGPTVKINNIDEDLLDNQMIFDYGETALQVLADSKRNHFVSIKKMLGYRNQKGTGLYMEDGSEVRVNGTDLTYFLIRHLYNKHKNAIETKNLKHFTDTNSENGNYRPQRAVYAIPNNFTATKIMALRKSIEKLNLFKEIRFIYEAEAVLIYYLFSKRKKTDGEEVELIDGEKILIYDMGGATVNVTLAQINKKGRSDNLYYQVDVLAKLGYGIGGDAIDYYVLKFINKTLEANNQAPMLLKNKKKRFAEVVTALDLKKRMVSNFSGKGSSLLYRQDFVDIIGLKDDALLDALENAFNKGENSDFYKYLKENILKEVESIIADVLKLSAVSKVDTVIKTGRSMLFPFISETVDSALKNSSIVIDKKRILRYKGNRLKTTVALGACYYGVNRNAIQLNNIKTSSSFGIQHTVEAQKPTYIEMVEMGQRYNHYDYNGRASGKVSLQSDFRFDSGIVNFIQVMGSDPAGILLNEQKHKYSSLAKVKLSGRSNLIAMEVSEKDDVVCTLEETNGRKVNAKTTIFDEDILDANAAHYTWLLDLE